MHLKTKRYCCLYLQHCSCLRGTFTATGIEQRTFTQAVLPYNVEVLVLYLSISSDLITSVPSFCVCVDRLLDQIFSIFPDLYQCFCLFLHIKYNIHLQNVAKWKYEAAEHGNIQEKYLKIIIKYRTLHRCCCT